jgi:hypothetical protein
MRKNIYEIFDEFENASSKEERIGVLQRNWTPTLQNVLSMAFDPNIKWKISGIPENYKIPDTQPGISYSTLNQELKRLYLFQVGNPTAEKLTETKQKELLLILLESLEPRQHEERGKHMHDLLRSLFPDLNVIGAGQLTSPQSVGKPPALHHENDLNEHQSNITSSEVDESRESSRPLGQSFKSLQQNHQNRDFNSSSSSSENSNFVISNINSNNNKRSSSKCRSRILS